MPLHETSEPQPAIMDEFTIPRGRVLCSKNGAEYIWAVGDIIEHKGACYVVVEIEGFKPAFEAPTVRQPHGRVGMLVVPT